MADIALQEAAPLFAALGEPTRLRLVTSLAESGPESITRLCDGLSVSRQAVTKHLQVLASAGIVRGRRSGRQHIWELTRERIDDARNYLDQIDAEWDATLARLKRMVEE